MIILITSLKKDCFIWTSFLLLVSHMVVVPLLLPLSQFGLFHQPQTSFTRSRNRESFTTLRRVSQRIEARRIRWKIMLTSSVRNITLLRSRDGQFYSKKSAIRIAATFFLKNTKLLRTHDSCFLQVEEKSERTFLFIRKLLCFSTESRERRQRIPSNYFLLN